MFLTFSVRFCVSASHTKDDLDRLLRACNEVGDILQLKFSSGIAGETIARPNRVGGEAISDSETLYEESISSFNPLFIGKTLGVSCKKPRWDIEEIIKCGVIDTTA
jgi:serine palmitoyltransferase